MTYTTETPAPESGADEMLVYANGTRAWRRNGLAHREDGPAYEWADGTRSWYRNGLAHREDGPAYEWADGTRWWCLDGVNMSEDEWREREGK